MKGKACDESRAYHETIKLPKDTSETDLMALLERSNGSPRSHGILVQLPLPRQIDTNRALHRIDPRRTWMAFIRRTVGKVVVGDPTGFPPGDTVMACSSC